MGFFPPEFYVTFRCCRLFIERMMQIERNGLKNKKMFMQTQKENALVG